MNLVSFALRRRVIIPGTSQWVGGVPPARAFWVRPLRRTVSGEDTAGRRDDDVARLVEQVRPKPGNTSLAESHEFRPTRAEFN